MTLTACALHHSLRSSTETSSTDTLLAEELVAFARQGVSTSATVSKPECDVRGGVTSDDGHSDEWPSLPQPILDADMFVRVR